jgi:putative membrane protein
MLIVRWVGGSFQSDAPASNQNRNTALDVLKDRFARGEIDADEYKEKSRVLKE